MSNPRRNAVRSRRAIYPLPCLPRWAGPDRRLWAVRSWLGCASAAAPY